MLPRSIRPRTVVYAHFFDAAHGRYVARPIGKVTRVEAEGVRIGAELIGWTSTRIYTSREEAEREALASPPVAPGISERVSKP